MYSAFSTCWVYWGVVLAPFAFLVVTLFCDASKAICGRTLRNAALPRLMMMLSNVWQWQWWLVRILQQPPIANSRSITRILVITVADESAYIYLYVYTSSQEKNTVTSSFMLGTVRLNQVLYGQIYLGDPGSTMIGDPVIPWGAASGSCLEYQEGWLSWRSPDVILPWDLLEGLENLPGVLLQLLIRTWLDIIVTWRILEISSHTPGCHLVSTWWSLPWEPVSWPRTGVTSIHSHAIVLGTVVFSFDNGRDIFGLQLSTNCLIICVLVGLAGFIWI